MSLKPLTPPPLTPGDTIGVMAPSSVIDRTAIEAAIKCIEQRGYKAFIHPQTYEAHNQSAGTGQSKAAAFHELWEHPDIRAIWAAGGGNRCLQMLDFLDYKKLAVYAPKIVIGYSDVTALLNALYAHLGLICYHGPVFKGLPTYPQHDHLWPLLTGKPAEYNLKNAIAINNGTSEGPLVGGNLSLFQYLPHTLPGKFWQGALLFLEDCNDELSRYDRMFTQLKRLGVLNEISGLILGSFTCAPEQGRPFGFSFKDIIREHTDGLNIPVVMDAPFGHGNILYTFPIGQRVRLEINEEKTNLHLLT